MKLLSMLLAAVFTASLASAAGAAEAQPKKEDAQKKAKVSLEDRFKRLDKNGDGKLDLAEYMGRATSDETKKQREKEFAEIDKDNDKAVTLDELKAWHKSRHENAAKKPKKAPKRAPKEAPGN